jgi:hypothetical protein
MGLFVKHPINSITLKPTSTLFPGKKNQKGCKTNGNEGVNPLNF